MNRSKPTPTVLYYGCHKGVGHYLHNSTGNRICEHEGLPWHRAEIDGRLQPTGPQYQGRIAHHQRQGWTALAWWDRSVDGRGKSSSTVLINAEQDPEQALATAKAALPWLFERINYHLRLIEPKEREAP